MRYLIYARKSSESEEKQAQSIEDQLKELRALAQQRSLTVVGEYTEARSAKAPGSRPVFAEVVAAIQSGEADALLCWHVNRLFRNPVDFGTVSWLLQTGVLQEIHTPHQVYRTGDNVLLLSVENGMANQYILDLKKAVERGLRSKVEKGWFPHKAPIGYLNHEGEIEKDPQRFPQIRRVWEMALSENFTTGQILQEMHRWGYSVKSRKGQPDRPISRATLYNVLSNIFYAGYFVRAGETHQGAHEPMISLTEFFQVQKFLKRNFRRHQKHLFTFNGLIRCGHCGCAVVGEHKRKKLSSGSVQHYTYYSCSNAKQTCQRRVISEDEIMQQLGSLLQRLSMPEGFTDYVRQVILRWKEEASVEREEQKRYQAQHLSALERQMDKLLELKMRDLLSDAEYLHQKQRLNAEVQSARQEQQLRHEHTDVEWHNLENVATLLEYGALFFEGGNPSVQHLIARTIGAQYILTDRRLAIELNAVFGMVAELKEVSKTPSETTKMPPSGAECLTWWGIVDTIRTVLEASGAVIPHLVVDQTVL